jgi:hypothetical protein
MSILSCPEAIDTSAVKRNNKTPVSTSRSTSYITSLPEENDFITLLLPDENGITSLPVGGPRTKRKKKRNDKQPRHIDTITSLQEEEKTGLTRASSTRTCSTRSCSSRTRTSTRTIKKTNVVSIREENNKVFKYPRVKTKYKSICWISQDEIHHNMMMNQIRRLVQEKIIKLLAKDDDYSVLLTKQHESEYSDTETTEIESCVSECEYEIDDDDDHQWEEQNDQGEWRVIKEEPTVLKPTTKPQGNINSLLEEKNRMVHNLVDAIMDQGHDEIYSFLTSKCTISFS